MAVLLYRAYHFREAGAVEQELAEVWTVLVSIEKDKVFDDRVIVTVIVRKIYEFGASFLECFTFYEDVLHIFLYMEAGRGHAASSSTVFVPMLTECFASISSRQEFCLSSGHCKVIWRGSGGGPKWVRAS